MPVLNTGTKWGPEGINAWDFIVRVTWDWKDGSAGKSATIQTGGPGLNTQSQGKPRGTDFGEEGNNPQRKRKKKKTQETLQTRRKARTDIWGCPDCHLGVVASPLPSNASPLPTKETEKPRNAHNMEQMIWSAFWRLCVCDVCVRTRMHKWALTQSS